MPLTVTEKTHWKERVEQRLQEAENEILKDKPKFLGDAEEEAVMEVAKQYGISKELKKAGDFEEQIRVLDLKKQALLDAAVRKIDGKESDPQYRPSYHYTSSVSGIKGSLKKRAEALLNDILSRTQTGRDVLNIRAQKGSALDAIWLATTTKQVKQLWLYLNEMTGTEPTELEKKALEIE